MRKRRMCYVAALGLALAMAAPATVMASATQNLDAGVSPQANANVVFGQPANLGSKFSKKGTLRIALFFTDIVGDPPSLDTVDVVLPEEVKLSAKGLDQCRKEQIEGQIPDAATAACNKSLIGSGFATALGIAQRGSALLFNGTKLNGNDTILVHIFTANTPIVLQGEIRNSPLGSPYGQEIHVPVSTAAGGGVPPGVVVTRTEFTKISKSYKDKKLLKKANKIKKKAKKASGKKKKKLKKKARRLKKKANKNLLSAKCTDGTLSYRADYFHAPPDPDQTATYEQPCTK